MSFANPLVSIRLKVKKLERSINFYQGHLGFITHNSKRSQARLGSLDHPFLHLVEQPAGKIPRRSTGLYHFAVLLPDRKSLARILKHMRHLGTPLQGFADHGVSEALYLQDPDGNGIEIYRDRPQERWPEKDGDLEMVTKPLQTQSLLELIGEEPAPWSGLPQNTQLGHVHLKVDDIKSAEHFYQKVLGMDLRQRYGNEASFFSYEGYHHHIGANTWTSKNASRAPEDALGLAGVTLLRHPDMDLSSRETVSTTKHHQKQAQLVQDPAGNRFLVIDKPATLS